MFKELDFGHFFDKFKEFDNFSKFPDAFGSLFDVFISKLPELVVAVIG
jgi:hypothetical protein